ncbi:hypothetical protein [Rheinheimera fenheensis]|uniref:hypothetical protein n=1 Tax=Rheinheimera fenheensis TaxID=3152295 RepID=UPI00325F6668
MTTKALDVHLAYAVLCKATYPVTGKTIVDSKRNPRMQVLISITVVLLLLVIGPEIVRHIVLDTPSPDEAHPFLYKLDRFYLDPISSFLWAMLGSCIFLIKKHSDLASDLQFDRQKGENGWLPRVVLGTVLGGMAPLVFDFNYVSETGVDQKAVAFLIGLSVKVFYGALEKTINEISERFNLTSVRADNRRESKSSDNFAAEAVESGNLTPEEAVQLVELLRKMKKGG